MDTSSPEAINETSLLLITPVQVRMARAALGMTTRELGRALAISAMAISRYENGHTEVMSIERADRMRRYFESQRIFFGPHQSISIGENIFPTERWLGLACYELLKQHGLSPTSRELLDAYQQSQRVMNGSTDTT